MLPSFEIYAQICSDRLMPWLPDNRNNGKFELLLYQTASSSPDSGPGFFSLLHKVFSEKQARLPAKLLAETAAFAPLSAQINARFPLLFFTQLPAESPRERFYQVLTDRCLAAGIIRDELFARQCEGPENQSFYLNKLVQSLYAIMQLPLPLCETTPEELRILAFLKLAMALHLWHLQKLQNNREISEAAFIHTRDWLQHELGKMYPAVEVHNFLPVYDRFVEMEADRKFKTGQPAPEAIPGRTGNTPDSELPEELSVVEMVQAMQQELNGVKTAFQALSLLKNREPAKPVNYLTGQEVCRLLHISKSTLRRYRDSGKIKFTKVGHHWRYDGSQFPDLKGKTGT